MNSNQPSEPGRVEFKPPADFHPPEQTEAGKDWDLVCSFITKNDGTICMTKLGDFPMPGFGGKDEDAKEDKPDYGEYSRSVMDGMTPPEAADQSNAGY